MIRATVTNPSGQQQELTFSNPEVLIGRDETCDISVGWDAEASRRHAKLFNRGGQWHVLDLDSVNGTYLNGMRVLRAMAVGSVSVVQIGSTEVHLAAATPPPPKPPPRPGHCPRCDKELDMAERGAAQSRRGMCQRCAMDVQIHGSQIMNVIREMEYRKELPRVEELEAIHRTGARLNLPMEQIFDEIKPQCFALLAKCLSWIKADGVITRDEARYFYEIQLALLLKDSEIRSLRDEMNYIRLFQDLTAGKLPIHHTDAILEPGEICYWNSRGTYQKRLTASYRFYEGQMLVTSKSLKFAAPGFGLDVPLSKVLDATATRDGGLALTLTQTKGSGYYEIEWALLVAMTIELATNVHKRRVVAQASGSRVIRQDVKAAVWARDMGQCVQCGDCSYLEYDHVIPFSLGGASSVDNLQLLCRHCNLKKGDSI